VKYPLEEFSDRILITFSKRSDDSLSGFGLSHVACGRRHQLLVRPQTRNPQSWLFMKIYSIFAAMAQSVWNGISKHFKKNVV
jgi:hypothetical protein